MILTANRPDIAGDTTLTGKWQRAVTSYLGDLSLIDKLNRLTTNLVGGAVLDINEALDPGQVSDITDKMTRLVSVTLTKTPGGLVNEYTYLS